MTRWSETSIAGDNTHHLLAGRPLYTDRFDEVLKFHAPGLAPVRRAGEAWHIRENGTPAYTRRFLRTFGYYEGRAAVTASDGWHHITVDGNDLYPERYAWCGNFQNGRCPVRSTTGEYHHTTPEGRPAYHARWRYVGDYRDGSAVVQRSDGHSTHIDPHGQPLHDHWFLDLDVFHKGFARARDETGWMHVDRHGQPAYARRFAAVEPFYNGQARVERHDGSLEIIDETAHSLIELRPAFRSEFHALSADIVGASRTDTLAVAVELHLIPALPATPHAVATRCGITLDGATRLLRALAELGIVTRTRDWDDDQALALPHHAREALNPGGQLVLVELLLDPESLGGGLCALHLRVVTGGSERTLADFDALLRRAGLRLTRHERANPLLHVLLASAYHKGT